MLHPQDGAPKIDQKTGEPIKINHPATLSDFINTSNSDFTNLTEKGWQEFLSLPTSAYSQPIFYVDPKLDPAIASAIRKGAERTLKVFTPYFQYHFPIYEILSTTADFENQSINNDPVLNLLKNQSNFILSTQKESFLRAASTGNQMATGSVIYENGKIVADAIVFRIPKSARENLTLDAAGSHETMHAVQYLTMTNFFLSPMWFNEGQATQIGDIFAMDNEKMTDVAKVMRLFSYPTGSNDLSKFENDDEWNCCDQLAYSRSMAATTYLTGKYGWPKVLKFMVGIGENGQSWQQSFQSAFGESYLDFYSEVKSYLDWLTPSQK
jgi:hypothetical protein